MSVKQVLNRYVLPQDEIGLKEWALSLRSAHKCSAELLASMARKAGKIYGTDGAKEAGAAGGAGVGGAGGARAPAPPAPNGNN